MHRGPVTSVVFSPDGANVATASEDATVRIWELPRELAMTGRELRERACNSVLSGRSQLLDTELDRAPILNPTTERDPCAPPPVLTRVARLFSRQ
jgi:WD40 repeat protein